MIDHVVDYIQISVNIVTVVFVPLWIRWYMKWRRRHDDRSVSAHLHAVGSATRGGLVGSVGGLSKQRIERALVRLCASGVIDRCENDYRAPTFKLSEGAEVLIED